MCSFKQISDVIDHSPAPDEKPAFVEGARTITFGDARREIAALASMLIGAGLEPGERVAVIHPNSWEYVRAIYASIKAGLIPSAFHPRMAPGEVERLVNICKPAAMLADARLLNTLAPAFAQFAGRFKYIGIADSKKRLLQNITSELKREIDVVDEGIPKQDAGHMKFPQRDSEAGAVIIFTTGTTGPPKGVLLSHRNILSVARAIIDGFELVPDDITLIGAALAHISAFTSQMVSYPMVGGTCCIARGFLAMPREVLDFARRCKITSMHGMPTSIAMIINSLEPGEDAGLNPRYIGISGMRVTRNMLDSIMNTFPGTTIYNSYGLTEASPRITAHPMNKDLEHADSVGRPLPFCKVAVVDKDDNFLPAGGVGELVSISPGNMVGYFDDEESTKRAFIGEWMRTGDLARLDEDGYIYLESRISDMINVGGEKVNPYEVEDAIGTVSGVKESLVVKKSHELMGEIPIALVIKEEGAQLDESDILRELKPMLSSFKMPSRVIFVDDFPRTKSGKYMRRLPEDFPLTG